MEYKELRELMEHNRSYRRFDESRDISTAELEKIVELCRFCASGRNLQPLKYRIVNTPEECGKIFPHLAWAGYLTEWPGPEPGERPTAYIVQCLDEELTGNPMCDDGLQLEAITLGAVSLGMGACIIKSFNKNAIAECLGLNDTLAPLHVVALGVPVEDVVIEAMKDGDIKYWRDDEKIHHVPKRSLEEILVK